MIFAFVVLSVLVAGTIGDDGSTAAPTDGSTPAPSDGSTAPAAPSEGSTDNGAFKKVADGFYEEWKKIDSATADSHNFEFHAGNNSLYLVSNRISKITLGDDLSQGGVVSKLDLTTKAWTHKPYKAVGAEGQTIDKVAFFADHLILIRFNSTSGQLGADSIFYWSEDKAEWVNLPSLGAVSPEAFEHGSFPNIHVVVSVPSPSSKEAYITTTYFNNAGSPGSEQHTNKLAFNLEGSNPSDPQLKYVGQNKAEHESFGVVDVVTNGDNAIIFVEDITTDGAFSRQTSAYKFKENKIENVTLGGTPPAALLSADRLHHTDKQVYLIGGNKPSGLAKTEPVGDVFALDLGKLEWRNTTLALPQHRLRDPVAFDGTNVYLATKKDGIFSAPLPQ